MGDGSSWHQFGVIRLEERGPVRLKKYVVSETKPVEVPVSHEDLRAEEGRGWLRIGAPARRGVARQARPAIWGRLKSRRPQGSL